MNKNNLNRRKYILKNNLKKIFWKKAKKNIYKS